MDEAKIKKYLIETGNNYLTFDKIIEGVINTEIHFKVASFPGMNKVVNSLEGLPYYMCSPNHITVPDPENSLIKLLIPHKDIKDVTFSVDPISRPTEIVLGIDDDGNDLKLDLAKVTHALLAGATGSGKSMLIHSILHSLLYNNNIDVIFADPKMVEGQLYIGFSKDFPEVLTVPLSHSEIKESLRLLVRWMNERYEVMASRGIRDAMEHWKETNYTDDTMRGKVLVIDEVADLLGESKEASSMLMLLSSKARAAGLRIILATQRPDAKIIDGAIKANYTTRICLKTASRADSLIVLGFNGAENLRGKGHGLLLLPTGELISFKSGLIGSRDMKKFYLSKKHVEKPEKYQIMNKDLQVQMNRMERFLKKEPRRE